MRRMSEIGGQLGVEVIHQKLGLTLYQITSMNLPTRPAKNKSAADKNWKYDFAVELDAMPPEVLRNIVTEALEPHMPFGMRQKFRMVEQQERAVIRIALSDLG